MPTSSIPLVSITSTQSLRIRGMELFSRLKNEQKRKKLNQI
jgi:hypothetical protein